jgi:hypothetical protein
MDDNEVEKHHLVFYIITIVVSFATLWMYNNISLVKGTLIRPVLYILISPFIVNLMIMGLYILWTIFRLKDNYEVKNPISSKDFRLTTPAVIIAVFMNNLLDISRTISPDNDILKAILLIFFTSVGYLAIYFLNKNVWGRIFRFCDMHFPF